jgi:HK97 family phage prohead protease
MGGRRETIEGRGRFVFSVAAVGAWEDEEGELLFEGVASSTSVDRQQERMSLEAMEQMAQCQGLPVLCSHRKRQKALGTVTECWVDEHLFRVQGKLDRDNPETQKLYERLQQGERVCLSVGGRVQQASLVWDDETGRQVRQIEGVTLDHVAVCSPEAAANPDTYLTVLAKAAAGLAEESEEPSGKLEGLWAMLQRCWPRRGQVAEGTGPGAELEAERTSLAARLGELEARLAAVQRAMDAGVGQGAVALAKCEAQEAVTPGQPQHLGGQRVKHTEGNWEGVL